LDGLTETPYSTIQMSQLLKFNKKNNNYYTNIYNKTSGSSNLQEMCIQYIYQQCNSKLGSLGKSESFFNILIALYLKECLPKFVFIVGRTIRQFDLSCSVDELC